MAAKEHKVIDAEIIGQPKKKIPLKKDSITLNILLIAVLVFLIGGAGFAIGRYTAPEPTVKIKKVPTDTMGNEWFTIKHYIDNMETPEEYKDTKFYAGFIQFKNGNSRLRSFVNVTHYAVGCSGEMFSSPGFVWCTNDWIVKLTETIPDSILTNYYKK